ncbi:uncharacterized protein LY89DRAFT_645551 [Mollisia scopiformis]|uniref:Uncharacterized protein n=1 Tax=Mollisia scopiformis TaxID=149040 RepID=A0A194X986_MOLSC|nr:uncharacterized protein LY89DRAFT_645551 [Mollisia scopiformis]KUJ16684.1 hypothetical protein LY89DRAFT_645551 [Mollisia scopiformis]
MAQESTAEPPRPKLKDSWSSLQDDYELRNVQKFRDAEQGSGLFGTSEDNRTTTLNDCPPPLHVPTRTRNLLFNIGLGIAVLDLCVMPIVYFYSLTFGAKLKRQTVFIVITCLFCMMTFAHYTHRCFRLMLKCSSRYGPIGWQRKWRLLEFTNVNFALCASIFEIVLVIGTSPESPLLRICTLPSAIICYYLGILFLLTSTLTHYQVPIPFEMSSTPKGAPFRPALLAILEDSGAIEYRGEVPARLAVLRRYEASPLFRRMIQRLSWFWGVGFLVIAIITTILIFSLEEEVAFGVGWGVPYVWATIYAIGTIIFVKASLREERRVWRSNLGITT